jgi:hypothetical protein
VSDIETVILDGFESLECAVAQKFVMLSNRADKAKKNVSRIAILAVLLYKQRAKNKKNKNKIN